MQMGGGAERVEGFMRTLTLGALGGILLRRWAVLLLVGALIGAGSYQFLSRRDPMFRATAAVYFQQGDAELARGPDLGYLNTQRDQMLSMPRLEEAIQRFDLLTQKPYRSVSDPSGVLAQRLSATTNKDTWVVKITLVDEFPERAKLLLDHLVDGFAVETDQRHEQRRQRERRYWEDKAASQQEDLQQRQAAVDELKRTAQIISRDPSANRHTRELAAARQEWLALTAEQQARVANLEQTTRLLTTTLGGEGRDLAAWSDLIGHLGQLPGGDEVGRFWDGWLDSRQQLAALAVVYGPKHPTMKQALQMEHDRHAQLVAIATTVRQRGERSLADGAQRLEALSTQIGELEKTVGDYHQRLVELELMEQDLAARREALGRLEKRIAELDIADVLRDPGMQVISPTYVEAKPYNVQPRLLILLSVFAGLVAGGAVAVLAELTNRYVRVDTVEGESGLKTLATLPFERSLRGGFSVADLVDAQRLREPFRMLAAAITLHARPAKARGLVIAVTSPVRDDGKSLCASMLAVTLALAGKRVLLIDCDLRCSRLHRIFGISQNEPGLSHLLAGNEEISPFMTSVENLEIITTGPLPPNPTSLIHGQVFEEVLASCAESYDVVLIDTPPAGIVSDAAVIARAVDGLLLVVRERRTPRSMLQRALSNLSSAQHSLIGVVVNAARGGQATPVDYPREGGLR
jgi:capsular exopolysaccharide synthesis family protein